MLAAKRNDVRRQLELDMLRLRLIETRIDGIENTEPLESLELRAKVLEPVLWMSHRFRCSAPDHASHIADEIAEIAGNVARPAPPPNVVAVGYGDFTDVDLDLEVGVVLDGTPPRGDLHLGDGSAVMVQTLPRVEAITGVRVGHPQLSSGFYAGLGRWLTANDADIDGPVRELFMRRANPDRGVEPIVEVQFPIRRRSR